MFIPDISGRGSDEARHRELLAVFTHVDSNERFFIIKKVISKRFRELSLSHPSGAEEQKRSGWATRITQPCAGAANGFADRPNSVFLADQTPRQLGFQLQQSFGFTLRELVHRNPCPRGHHGGNVLISDLVVHHAVITALGALRALD